ncbi:hypothetical protein KP79_PYT11140 [Mizuhopecten yessoensis]|uniref:Uncharacterized protein n=2 Tax=Mizuhopecten yessoensis TaxID=6573 RepID=A0A210QRS7_MIZYE|nr:hypothetical protein KP79_PYT11140 [Mizuhopecten yessoensis]
MNATDFGPSTPQSSQGGNDTVFEPNSTMADHPLGSSRSDNNCSIFIDKTSEDLEQALVVGSNMLFMIFSFRNDSRTIPISVDTPQPLTWVHVSGNHGKGLFWLRQDFEMLSLTSLSYGVDNLEIYMSDSPEGCLSTTPASEIAQDVKDLVLNNLASDPMTNISWIGSEICNARFRFREHETGTEVYFVCCKKDAFFKTTCYELKRNKWMNVLLLCILVLPFIALMFAPLLIPVDLFQDGKADVFFQHKVSSQFQIRVTKQSSPDRTSKPPLEISKTYFKDMPRFCSTIATLNDNLTYDCTLEKISFYVDRDNLIGKDTDPFGPLTMLYTLLSRYELRRHSFGEGNSFREYMTILYGKILNTGYLLLIITLVNIPIIVKLIFFIIQVIPAWYITNSLENLDLNSNLIQYSSFGVSIIPRLELYLIYLVLIGLFVLVQFFKIRGTHRVDIVIEILKQCLRDSRKRRIKLAFQTLYKACRFSIIQCIMKGWHRAFVYLVLFLPFVVFNFVFYLLPTVNLVCSIPIYLFFYVLSNKCGCLSRSRCVRAIAKCVSDWLGLNPIFLNQTDGEDVDDSDSVRHKPCSPADTFIILILVFSLPVLIFVVLDSLSFYIDIIIYVLIGLLLNASVTTTYVILSLMLVFYIRDLFDNVTNRYVKFNNTIIGDAMTKTREDVLKVSLLNENLQKNTAFQLINETPLGEPDAQKESNSPIDNFKLSHEAGVLLWRTKRLIFFLDRKDTPYIPKKFFTETCVMDCVGTPGPLGENLWAVTIDILRIFVFLFFILLVALAFSEETESPGTNQTLTVIAGGLVPWLLRKVLQVPTEKGVDVENLHFREVFNNAIRKYEETWTVADIDIASVKVSEDQTLNEMEVIRSEDRDMTHDSHEMPECLKPSSTSRELSIEAIENVPSSSRSPKADSLEHKEERTTGQSSFKHDHLVVLVNKKSTRSQVV